MDDAIGAEALSALDATTIVKLERLPQVFVIVSDVVTGGAQSSYDRIQGNKMTECRAERSNL